MRSKLFSAVICLAACGLLGNAAHAEVCDDIGISTSTTLERLTIADLPAGERPLLVTAPPGDTSRIFIVAQDGIIWVKQIGSALTAQSVYMDIEGRVNSGGDERGLLGLAFDPNFASNGLFYVNYINLAGDTIVARFMESGGVGNADNERALLFIDQTESNHNGGQIMFGPDDMLYVFTGDGGGGGDGHGACGNGQNIDTLNLPTGLNPLLGKILRIDPNHSGPTEADCGGIQLPYGIPAGNPFVGQTGCDEIYAYGLRNPWRNDFDDLTGDLYVADVGQGCWEEVTYIPAGTGAGANLGWRQMEGTHCYNPAQGCFAASAAGCSPACNDPSLTDPVYDYRRNAGNCSITGGVVYRGCRMANFQGTYFYADYCVAQTLSFEVVGGNDTNHTNWTALGQIPSVGSFQHTSFGEDSRGEMYITGRNGFVYAIEPPYVDLNVGNFLLDDGNWNWADLDATTWRSIPDNYRVNKSTNDPDGDYCRLATVTTNSYVGDPDDPAPGELWSYTVTAFDGADETDPGGPERTLTGLNCP